jgi:hypothetical protein
MSEVRDESEALPAVVETAGNGLAIHGDLERLRREIAAPEIVRDAGPNAEYAYADFFKARISNPNTRIAYERAVDRFHKTLLMVLSYTAAKAPLFRTARKKKRELSDRGLSGNDLLRIVKRRLRGASLPPGAFCCHSFRATTATNLLKQKVPREQVQYLLGHSAGALRRPHHRPLQPSRKGSDPQHRGADHALSKSIHQHADSMTRLTNTRPRARLSKSPAYVFKCKRYVRRIIPTARPRHDPPVGSPRAGDD